MAAAARTFETISFAGVVKCGGWFGGYRFGDMGSRGWAMLALRSEV